MESVENVTPIRKYRARRAGESLDTRVSYLLGLSVFALAAFCFLAGALTGRRILPADQDLDHIYLAIMLVCLAAFIAIALKLDRQYRNAVLGREGEREVGAQLVGADRVGQRAPGPGVGDEHRLAGREDLGRNTVDRRCGRSCPLR